MKKVRNLLILLLAALMLSVFVGCAPEPEVEEVKPVEKKVGDLVITKCVIPPTVSKDTVMPEGIDINGNFKLIAVKNIGKESIDLTGYGIAYSRPDDADYRSAFTFPKTTIAPNATLYVLNDRALDKLQKMLPNLLTIPEAKDGEPIVSDAYVTNIPGFYNDETKVELAKDIEYDTTNAGGHKMYTWTKLDEVTIDGNIPPRDSLLIRDYDETTKADKGWTKLDWKDLDSYKKLDAVKGTYVPPTPEEIDYSFAKFNETVLANAATKLPEKGMPWKFVDMTTEQYKAFQKDAANNTPKYEVTKDDYNLYINNNGVVLQQNKWGEWDYIDYKFSTFETELKKATLKDFSNLPKIKYYYMPESYKTIFMEDAKAYKPYLDKETKTFSVVYNNIKFSFIDKAWSATDQSVDYSFETFKKNIIDALPKTAEEQKTFDPATLPKDIVYSKMDSTALKTLNEGLFTYAKEDYIRQGITDADMQIELFNMFDAIVANKKFYFSGIIQDDTGLWTMASAPAEVTKPKATNDNQKSNDHSNNIVITSTFVGGWSAKYIAVKNISTSETVDLTNYRYGKNDGKTTEWDNFPAVKLAPGKTIYLITNSIDMYYNTEKGNHLFNMTSLTDLNAYPELKTVKTNNAYFKITSDVPYGEGSCIMLGIENTETHEVTAYETLPRLDKAKNDSYFRVGKNGWEHYKTKSADSAQKYVNSILNK